MNAGPVARRSASTGCGGDRVGDGVDAPGPASDADRAGSLSPSNGAASPPTDPAPARRRRRLRPSSTTIFLGASGVLAAVFDAATILRRARRGPWRAEVAEDSMAPALLPGDWLLLDPTCRRWPRPGTIVVIREPGSGVLAIKRVAARGSRRDGGSRRDDGGAGDGGATPGDGSTTAGRAPAARPPDAPPRHLGSREAWVLGDAVDGSIDSRAYGPLDADALVARAWFRYGPAVRVGRLR